MVEHDLERTSSVDKSNMLDGLARFPEQIKEALAIAETVERFTFLKVDDVVVSGMGGSAISGDILASLFRDTLDVPLVVNRDYDLPKWVNKDTLVLCMSYSGNTSETLSSFKLAYQKKCKIICISTGGKLQELAEKRQVPFVKIPAGLQPRAATPYLLFPAIVFLKKIGLVKTAIETDIQETITITQEFITTLHRTVPLESNPAKQLATKIHQTIPQVYGWGVYAPIALRWRHQFNENSKVIARTDIVPECNHNDLVGWSANPEVSKLFSCILFRDRDEELVEMTRRLEFMHDLCSNMAGAVIEVTPKGKSRLAKMMYFMCLGDFTSCYLAVLRGIDPSPVDIITALKNRLAEK
ncbi:MAG: bifunctional phosphoglucose/phosphomannose isomerase [Candidatus Thermoplasmatota archaeon]|nr:bifunctional phosphoglucose/phosphomannose isomerase [Candidatus Thermoplasmatota archaeon]